jgi:hypothetical protein
MNAQALEDLKGVDYVQPDIVGDFPEDLPDRGAFKIKTGGAGHVRENDLSMEELFQRKMGVKIFRVRKFLFIFLNKTIESKNTNGRIFDIKSILQQRK